MFPKFLNNAMSRYDLSHQIHRRKTNNMLFLGNKHKKIGYVEY